MQLKTSMRVKDIEAKLVGTVTLIDGPQARVEFDNGMLGIYSTNDDPRLAPPVGYYEWLRIAQLKATTVEAQLNELRATRKRWLTDESSSGEAALEMSCAIGELLRTLGVIE